MSPPANEPLAVPGGRLARLARLGTLASGVAGGMLAEGVRQLARGRRPVLGDLLLTPGNARRLAEQLAQLRGAAMKVGQLLSMDAGELIPPELAAILARLRTDARPMPMSQLVGVLNTTWGAGWEQRFQRFSFAPLAAASIGQVHAAQTHEGPPLAIKIQYPGVRQSITSDVDNVVALLRLAGLLPRSMDISALLDETERQLHDEADYLKEAAQLTRFGGLLAARPEFVLPRVHEELSTGNILVMSFVESLPVESLIPAAQGERDRVLGLLFELMFNEIFTFRRVQTDPNFANYRYQPESGRLVLLDFGAVRVYAKSRADAYRRLLDAGLREDRDALNEAAAELGYFQVEIADRHRRQLLDLFVLACEPLRHRGAYDFAASDLALRVRDAGMRLGLDRDFRHTPPADALFLHRKIGGLYLLAARLGARVDIRALFLASGESATARAP